jgi:hypothetical protein
MHSIDEDIFCESSPDAISTFLSTSATTWSVLASKAAIYLVNNPAIHLAQCAAITPNLVFSALSVVAFTCYRSVFQNLFIISRVGRGGFRI